MIIYFSSTGNSRYVSEYLADQLNDTAISIMNIDKNEISENKMLGIVSPTYYWGLPSIMKDFIMEKIIKITKETYVFFVSTYGKTSGGVGNIVQKLLSAKDIILAAKYGVKMPDDYTPVFDLSDRKKVNEIIEKEQQQIEEIIAHIKSHDVGDYINSYIQEPFGKFGTPLYEISRKTRHLKVNEKCISCGRCEKECPSKAIKIRNGKPVWINKKCALCLHCVHFCPQFAISYGKNTEKHGQYIHPEYKRLS